MDQLLSEENIKRISNSLASIEALTGAVGDQHEDIRSLIVSARHSSEQLEKTLSTTDKAVSDVDRELVQKLPALIAKLDGTLSKLDSAATGVNGIVNDNRAAIGNNRFSPMPPTMIGILPAGKGDDIAPSIA